MSRGGTREAIRVRFEVGARGSAVLRGLLSPGAVERISLRAEERLAAIPGSALDGDRALRLASGERWLPTASSLQVDEALVAELLSELSASRLPATANALLGTSPQVLVDQAWLRRQYPPESAPPHHHAHAWHQDGALHATFAEPDEPLLEMLTVWIPLTACGVDAPGLEILPGNFPKLLSPGQLPTAAESHASWSPRLRPGDAMLMTGEAVHRTSVTATMSRPRTSIEVRIVPEAPRQERLTAERRCPLPSRPRTHERGGGRRYALRTVTEAVISERRRPFC